MAKYPDVTAGQTEACINRLGGWNNFLRFIGGEGRVIFDSLLTPVRSVVIPAQPDSRFASFWAGAGVVSMSDRFQDHHFNTRRWFPDESHVNVYKLEKGSTDVAILEELGDRAKISLAQFRGFLALNMGSEELFLAYVADGAEGKLSAVTAFWDKEYAGWRVRDYSVTYPRTRRKGTHVICK
jgi:hypothetical protein